jgi:hypothetical protein
MSLDRTSNLALALLIMMLGLSRAFVVPRSIALATRRLASAATADAETAVPIVNENAYEECTMDDIVSLCKRRGFIFPSSEIYNGYAGFYDYGPLGAELKKNVKDAWWKNFVQKREDVVGLDSSIIHNPTTWKSSGTSTKVWRQREDIISRTHAKLFQQVMWMDSRTLWLTVKRRNCASELISSTTHLSAYKSPAKSLGMYAFKKLTTTTW